jgi:hypothetical protein
MQSPAVLGFHMQCTLFHLWRLAHFVSHAATSFVPARESTSASPQHDVGGTVNVAKRRA